MYDIFRTCGYFKRSEVLTDKGLIISKVLKIWIWFNIGSGLLQYWVIYPVKGRLQDRPDRRTAVLTKLHGTRRRISYWKDGFKPSDRRNEKMPVGTANPDKCLWHYNKIPHGRASPHALKLIFIFYFRLQSFNSICFPVAYFKPSLLSHYPHLSEILYKRRSLSSVIFFLILTLAVGVWH